MSYGIYVTYTVDDIAKKEYDTGKLYQMGTNTLFVYVNGLLTEVDKDYLEVGPKTIGFVDDLQAGDRIIITSSFINKDLELEFPLIGKGSNALFKLYDDKTHLMNNQTYTLDIALGEQSFSYSFTSKYSPMFSTEKIIRMDLQEVSEDVDSDVINFTIWQNSKLAIELTDSSGDYQYYSNADDIDLTTVPYYAKQWVRYKTEIDLLNAVYLSIASKQGRERKKLGNMEIERQYNLPYVSDMLKGIKEKLVPFERLLTGRKVIAKATRKAGSTSYPLSDRRSF